MADLFLGLDRGGTAADVATDSSTTGKDVEIVIDDAVGLHKSEVIQLLKTLTDHLLTNDFAIK